MWRRDARADAADDAPRPRSAAHLASPVANGASIPEERERPQIVTVPMGDVRDTTMTVFDELHRLVDALDEEHAREALTYLQQLQHPHGVRDAPLEELPELAEEPPVVVETKDELGGDDLITTEEATRRLADPPPAAR